MSDQGIMRLARQAASNSPDPSTKVGCIIRHPEFDLNTEGFNGFPTKVRNEGSRWVRPVKYDWVVHAEARALMAMARQGVPTFGAICYSTQIPCSRCTGLLIEAGIKKIVCPNPETLPDTWRKNAIISMEMIIEAQVRLVYVPSD